MADVPYRLWSDEAPVPPPAHRTVIAKLKPTTEIGRRAAFGFHTVAKRAARRDGEDEPESQVERLVRNERVKAVKPVLPAEAVTRARGLVTVEVPQDEDPKLLARHLHGLGAEVEYAYVPHPRRMFAKKSKKPKQTNDPLLSRQWGHMAVRIAQARKLAGFKEGTKITVAVADSGVDVDHPDLSSVIAEYKSFLTQEGKRDYVGHGTHVSGIIAARMNNGIGVAGLCAAKILALKVLPGRTEWNPTAYYRSLSYCIGRAQVLNLSLGDENFDPGERDVILDLLDAGVVVVAAMGNEYKKGNPIEYPAAIEGVCAVGATDHADRRAGFSNTGKHIAVTAPGVSIVSTTPTYEYGHGETDYDTWDGTSMATPHVTAAAALVLARDPDLKPAEVIKRLQRGADKVDGMKNKQPTKEFGWGRLNIERALKA